LYLGIKLIVKICSSMYNIGQSKQFLDNRIKNQKNSVKCKKMGTAPSKHLYEQEHLFDFDNVSILDKENKQA